jgi:DNA polymerase-3 subunit gamma/tau
VLREDDEAYTANEGALTVDDLRRRWSAFLDALRPRNLPLEALMRSCEPLAVQSDSESPQDRVVVLAFEHEFHRARVADDKNRDDVEDVLCELTGQSCRIRCVMQDQAAADDAVGQPAAADGNIEARNPIEDDPVVRAAVEDLGAEVLS